MSEFKVGDKVRVRQDAYFFSGRGFTAFRNADYRGTVTYIVSAEEQHHALYRVQLADNHETDGWDYFEADELERVEPAPAPSQPDAALLQRQLDMALAALGDILAENGFSWSGARAAEALAAIDAAGKEGAR